MDNWVELTFQTVILAGGIGSRIGSLTKKFPKSLIPIHGKPFLNYQIDLLIQNGMKDIVLCLGYKSEAIVNFLEKVNNFGIRIHYSCEQELMGTGGALKVAEPLIEGDFLLLNGDSYTPINFQNLLKEFRKLGKMASMVVYKNRDRYDKSNVAIEKGSVIKYDRRTRSPSIRFVDYGVTVMKKEVLSLIPENTFTMLDSVYEKLVARNQLGAFQVNKRFYEIGSFEGIKSFEAYANRYLL